MRLLLALLWSLVAACALAAEPAAYPQAREFFP
jgi:hypothetical protein